MSDRDLPCFIFRFRACDIAEIGYYQNLTADIFHNHSEWHLLNYIEFSGNTR